MLAQRRNIDGHNIQAVVKVFAKRSFFQRRAQITIRGGDQPHIHLDGLGPAQPLKLALLQYAQQLYLDRRGHIADFIEKQRAFVRQFEFSRLAREAPVKAPFS